MQPAVYLNFCDDLFITSLGTGAAQKYVITPKKFIALGLNLAEFVAGLRISNLDTNGGITLKWQWSLDGVIWSDGSTVMSEKTAKGDYRAVFSTNDELLPFVRLILEVRDTTAALQKTAQVSVWGYYKFRA